MSKVLPLRKKSSTKTSISRKLPSIRAMDREIKALRRELDYMQSFIKQALPQHNFDYFSD